MVANNSPRNDAFRHQQVLAAYYNIARQLADRIDSCEHKPSCWSRNEPVGDFCAETSEGSASAANSLGKPWRATISTLPFGTASLFQAFSGTARFMSTMNRAKGADATNLTCCSTGQSLESRCGTRLRPSNESRDELFNDPNYGGELQNLSQPHSRSALVAATRDILELDRPFVSTAAQCVARHAVAIPGASRKDARLPSGERRCYDPTIAEVVQEIADAQRVSIRARRTDYARR